MRLKTVAVRRPAREFSIPGSRASTISTWCWRSSRQRRRARTRRCCSIRWPRQRSDRLQHLRRPRGPALTPRQGILEGITRETVMELADDAGLAVEACRTGALRHLHRRRGIHLQHRGRHPARGRHRRPRHVRRKAGPWQTCPERRLPGAREFGPTGHRRFTRRRSSA